MPLWIMPEMRGLACAVRVLLFVRLWWGFSEVDHLDGSGAARRGVVVVARTDVYACEARAKGERGRAVGGAGASAGRSVPGSFLCATVAGLLSLGASVLGGMGFRTLLDSREAADLWRRLRGG